MKAIVFVHEWKNPATNLVFTTIPMVHVAEYKFYKEIQNIIDGLNCVLTEGIGISPDISHYF